MTETIIWNLAFDEWERFKVQDKFTDSQVGTWRLRHFRIEPGELTVERIVHLEQGRDIGEGDFVALQFLAPRSEEDATLVWHPMMSDSRAEIWEHYVPIDQMHWAQTKRVLIHGLGLGMVLNAALMQPHVEHVDVVELSEDVIKLVGPAYESDPRVTIHHGDAFTYRFPPGTRWDIAWHDIWPTINSDNLPEMEKLHRRYGGRVGWQDSWARSNCLSLRNRERLAETNPDKLVKEEWDRYERIHGKEQTAMVRSFLAATREQNLRVLERMESGGQEEG
jgi:hypothetical protein